MKNVIALVLLLGVGCAGSKLAASKDTLQTQASKELECAGTEATIVYYGIRSESITADSPCFGPTADKIAVVDCGGKRRAYWGFGDRWELRPGEVVAADAAHAEIAEPGAENASGSVQAVARCGH